MKLPMVAAGALILAISLTGCWEDTEVVLHEPGQYKGPTDDLTQGSAGDRDQVLMERFKLVQIDR